MRFNADLVHGAEGEDFPLQVVTPQGAELMLLRVTDKSLDFLCTNPLPVTRLHLCEAWLHPLILPMAICLGSESLL